MAFSAQDATDQVCVLSRQFLAQAASRPQAAALKTADKAVVTYSQLRSRARAIKQALEAKLASEGQTKRVGRGLVVAVACGNSLVAEICAVLGVIISGGCFVPIDETLPKPRLVEILDDAHPDAIIQSRRSSPDDQVGVVRSSVRTILEAWRSRDCVLVDLDDNGNILSFSTTGSADCDPANGDTRQVTDHPLWKISSPCFAESAAFPVGTDAKSSNGPDTQGIGDHDGRSEYVLALGASESMLLEHSNTSSPGMSRLGASVASTSVNECRGATDHRRDRDLLYMLYTSGTTGVPKGVRGTRSGALNRVRFGWMRFPYRDEGELVARRTSSCFVDFVAELLTPLLAGVPLAIFPDGVAADPLRLVPALAEARVTRVTLTPSLLALVLRTTASLPGPLLPDLHTWMVSGEALHPELAFLFHKRTAPGTQLVNLYGSTEVAGDATYCTLDEIIETSQPHGGIADDSLVARCGGVLIGKPLPGVHLSVVGPDLTPVAMGEAGELLVGGVGVALGYHGHAKDTAGKFLRSSPFGREVQGHVSIAGLEPGQRVVRTGDRVVQPNVNGPLFWLGKLDGEVKVRGVRVSLHEVEMLACNAANLPAGAFVVSYDPGRTDVNTQSNGSATNAPDRGRLLGFVARSGPRDYSKSSLRELKTKLAAEMGPAQLPAVLVPIEGGFPLTTSGKVDRQVLLKMFRDRTAEACAEGTLDGALLREISGTGEKLDPATEAVVEAVVTVLPDARAIVMDWLAQSMETPRFSQSVNFTDIGGTSLLAVEAAWLASRTVATSETRSLQASATLLTAEDFFRESLAEVVLILQERVQSAANALATKPSAAITAIVYDRAPPKLTVARPIRSSKPVPAMASFFRDDPTSSCGHALAGRKRRLEVGAGTRHPRSFVALGRAGAGLRYPLKWLGVSHDSTGDKGAVVAGVEFRILWRSCLTKCIDATPLVVVPRQGSHPLDPDIKSASTDDFCDVDPGTPVSPIARANEEENGGGGTVLIGSHSGEFQKLDLVTGEVKWSFFAGDRLESGAACADDGSTVFVGCHDRKLYAIDHHAGTLTWSSETGDVIKCTPVCTPPCGAQDICNGQATSTVLVGSHDGILRSFSQVDGKLYWDFDCGGALFASPAHDSDVRIIYAATTKGRLIALDSSTLLSASPGPSATPARATGANGTVHHPVLLWEHTLPAPCFSSPAVCDKVLVLGCVDGGLYCFSYSGEKLWVSSQGTKPVFSSPCLLPHLSNRRTKCKTDEGTGPHVVWGCHDGRVRCQRGVGSAAWETDIDQGQPVFSSPFFAAVTCEACSLLCPLIFACSVSGLIAALRASDGVVVGTKNLPGAVFSSPVVVGKRLLVGCRDNHTYAIDILAKCSRCV